MKAYKLIPLLAAVAVLAGCKTMSTESMLNTGALAFKAATLSDAEVKQMADGACAEMDKSNQIAPASSAYTQRLAKISKPFGDEIQGSKVNYKVYMTKDVNAWAMANGCVRVYSGLMDLMDDKEVQGVVGHEIGHVVLGHSKKAMQVAYSAAAARYAAANAGNSTVSALSNSQFGELGQALINSQFSQSQETESDAYSVKLLIANKLNPNGMATSMDKIGKLGGSNSMFSSHPPSQERADKIRALIAENPQAVSQTTPAKSAKSGAKSNKKSAKNNKK